MIRYHFDLYPRDDPKNGAKLVRFTKLQSAEYRGEANGTGSGRFSIRADTAEAQFIDPSGLQYVRVVREDTVAATEAVVGGFFLDSGDFSALDERGTRLLTFGGAGTLSYLSRAIMASHTYISPIFTGQDPIAGVWNLWNQSTFYANGNYLGAMLWRVLYEATHFTPGTHRHADGINVSDTHADDRPENALPDLTMGFDAFNDSNAAAWTVQSGEFKAQVGENVLQVVKRLMEAGLYVDMDPDTFELNAYPASSHRRTRTGASWGANVVRFQAPTGGDIDTGNIKSDAKRAIAAFIKRSWLLAGSNDTYGDATGTSDIPWEGFYHSDTADATALAGIAGVQTGARDDAGDTARLRIRLGTDTSNGYYRPFEDVRLDDLVTVHTGTTQWDWNEQNFPVAAITVTLREGGDWDAWVELGSSYSATPGRQFQVSPVAAHNHLPNPELCRPGNISAVATSVTSSGGAWNSDQLSATVASGTGALYAVMMIHGESGAKTVTWKPNAANGAQDQTMTLIGSVVHPTGSSGSNEDSEALYIYRLANPNPSVSGPFIDFDITGGYLGGGFGYWAVESDAAATVTTNSGTGTSSTVTPSAGTGNLVLDAAGWRIWSLGAVEQTPNATAGQTENWAVAGGSSAGQNDGAWGGGSSTGSGARTWDLVTNTNWVAAAIVIGGTSAGTVGDGHIDLVGTSPRAARCDHRHDVHRDTAPTVNDDWATAGYKLGTIWAQLDDLVTPTEIVGTWMLVDISTGAAVWLPMGGGADDQTAAEVPITDSGGYFTGTDVEAALQELGALGPGAGGDTSMDDLITAHRLILWANRGDLANDGDSGDSYPENSLEGFVQAMVKGLDGIEVDVGASSDGTFHAMHDTTLDRTTDLTGNISSASDATLAGGVIDAGYGYNTSRHGSSIGIPTLAEIITACEPWQPLYLLELKSGTATSLAEFVVAQGIQSRTIITVPSVAEAEAVKAVSARIHTLMNEGSAGEGDDAVDWLSWDYNNVTSTAAVTATAPQRPHSYIPTAEFETADEDTILPLVVERGIRSWETYDATNALSLRGQILYPLSDSVLESAGYWEPVTNGDVGSPEIVFDNGDVVMEWVDG